MSGKAMQDAVLPAGTVREVTRRKSEGHGAEFAASLLPTKSAFAAPKWKGCLMVERQAYKSLIVNDLV
jgi:hypothetical protein